MDITSQITEFIIYLFSPDGFPARWVCGQWTQFHGWLYVFSNIAIWGAYFSIPVILVYFVRKRKDIPFTRIFWLFALFIFACGSTHLVDATLFWYPVYRFAAVVLLFTAVISWATVFALIPIIPQVMALRSPAELKTEILEREKTEKQLKQLNEELESRIEQATLRYKVVLEGSNEGLYEWNLRQNAAYWSDRFYDILGLAREELPEPTYNDFIGFIHPDDRGEVITKIDQHLIAHEKYEMEFRMKHKGGQYRFILCRGQATFDENKEPVLLSGLVRDITEKREMQQKLLESEERFRSMIDTMPVMYGLTDKTMKATYFNQPIQAYTGLSMQDLMDQGWVDSIHPDEREEFLEHYASAFKNKELIREEIRFKRHDGQYRWVLAVGAPRLTPDHEVIGFHGSLTDIHEQKILEYQLRESENRKSAILSSSIDAIITINSKSIIEDWNPAAETILGYTRDEVIGKEMPELIIPQQYREGHYNAIQHYLQTGETSIMNRLIEMPVLRKNGTEFTGELIVTAISQNGDLEEDIVFTGIIRDITNRKKMEQEMYERAAIVESSQDAIISKNMEGIILSWNEAAERLYGYSEEEAVGKNISIIYPADQQKASQEILSKLKQGEKIEPFETIRIKKDGTLVDILLAISPVKNIEGEIIAAAAITHNISEQKRLTRQLQESEAKFRRLADSDLMGVAFWHIDGTVYEANQAFLNVLGFTQNDVDVKQLNWIKQTVSDFMPLHEEGIQEALEGGLVKAYEVECYRKDGEIVTVLMGYTMLQDSQERGVLFMVDITQEKLYQKTRETFMATLTHDLKTPIYGTARVLELMEEGQFGQLTKAQKNVLGEMQYSNQYMARLVDNMLATHLYEKGMFSLQLEKTDVNQLITQCLELYSALAREKNQKIILNLDTGLPPVMVDAFEIQRVFNNLIDNAITFTPNNGEITLSTTLKKNKVTISVQDTGPGIAEDELKDIFSQYKRTHRKFRHVGVGLGLYLSRQIIEAHGGTIEAESTEGRGSRFHFCLQAAGTTKNTDAKGL